MTTANLLSNRLVNQTQIKKKAEKGEEIKKEREKEREKVERLREILFKALREKERLQGEYYLQLTLPITDLLGIIIYPAHSSCGLSNLF